MDVDYQVQVPVTAMMFHTPLGQSLRDAVAQLPQRLKKVALGHGLNEFRDLKAMYNMTDAALNEMQEVCDRGLPYFIHNELNDPETIPNLRQWQRRFWREATLRWNPAWDQPPTQQRLLQHACTGAGNSDIIVMAPFADARQRCLVVVPGEAILNGLKAALGSYDEEVDEQPTPTLRARGLLADYKPLPKVLALPGIKPAAVVARILDSKLS